MLRVFKLWIEATYRYKSSESEDNALLITIRNTALMANTIHEEPTTSSVVSLCALIITPQHSPHASVPLSSD